MATSLRLCLLLASASLVFACTGDDDGGDDKTVRDGGTRDTGVRDGGDNTRDGGDRDAGEDRDAGPRDGGEQDLSQQIVFIHTNDEHSKLLGASPNIDDYPDLSMMPAIKGGILRRATVMQAVENEANAMFGRPPIVRVGAGDIVMGSLMHLGNLAFGVDYALAGVLQYDVLTLGNHEFDFGIDFLAGMINNGTLINPLQQTFGPLQIPLLASNIRFSMTSPDDDILAAFYGGGTDQPIRRTFMQQHGDLTVGYVGVIGLDAALVAPFKQPVNFSLAVDEASTCTNDVLCPGSICVPPSDDPTSATGKCALDPTGRDPVVNFPALVADIASAVAELRSQGADLVVAVSHSGINEREVNTLQMMGMGLENAVRSEEIVLAVGVDQALAAAGVDGLDLIIGGHSHTALAAPLAVPNARSGSTTYIVQAGSYGEWVGKIRMFRGSPADRWEADPNYAGLEPVDGTVQAQANIIIEQFVQAIIDGLEQNGLATPGDGTIFPGEQCDTGPNGDAFPNNGNCLGVIPGAASGTLQCFTNRQLDSSQCVLAQVGKEVCGNSAVGGAEQCDTGTVPLDCEDLGYLGGTTTCHSNCTINTSQCMPNFFSLLEIVVNFNLDTDETTTIWDANSQRGDLFFFPLGTTSFDVGDTNASAESNLANLVADANRFAINELDPDAAQDPVRVAIVANGIIRDGIYQGETGVLSLADLFRVMPLGVSPVESTPGHSLIDFKLTAAELKAVFEIGLSVGSETGAFWLGYSGVQVEYDLSLPVFDPANPTTTGQVTLIELQNPGGDVWEDTNASFEAPLFDLANGGFTDAGRLLHVASDVYIGLYATAFGICPRVAGGVNDGTPYPHCSACANDNECTVPGGFCDTTAGRCTGGNPVAFSVRTLVPTAAIGFRQELKEFLALTTYVRRLPGDALPMNYSESVPRRICCVGTMCPTDDSLACPARPAGK